jgi:uncharacterized protein YegJ (DUF2314 family)
VTDAELAATAQPGDFVKIRLRTADACERVWVQLREVGAIGFRGVLANEPFSKVHHEGTAISAEWHAVLDYEPLPTLQ